MPTIGLISNRRSRRNLDGLHAIEAVLADAPEVVHAVTETSGDLGEVLADFAGRGVGVLAINGGDGTVQTMLTRLLEGRPFEALPYLAILPRGTANTTASDIGLRGKPAAALARLIAASRHDDLAAHVVERPVLRIDNVEGAGPQRGMMIGAGAIPDAIELCCREVYARGLKGDLAIALTLGAILLGSALSKRKNGILRPHDIGVALDAGGEQRTERLLVLATTLHRLILGSRPFWNYDGQPIRFTSVAFPPERLLLATPKVLYGWRRHVLCPEVYQSRGAWQIALRLDGPFTVDGETFRAVPDRPLVITAADQARFIRL